MLSLFGKVLLKFCGILFMGRGRIYYSKGIIIGKYYRREDETVTVGGAHRGV